MRFHTMAEFTTLNDLLLAQSESKLQKMLNGIDAEIERLGLERRVVLASLERKRAKASAPAPASTTKTNGRVRTNELSRSDLYAFLVEYGKPAKPTPLARFISAKGTERKPEAVRNGLVRLLSDGKLARDKDGSFVVVSHHNGDNGIETTSGGTEAQSR